MKKLVFLAGALIVTALSAAVFFTDKPLTEQEKLILRNVEAIAQDETVGGNGQCGQTKSVREFYGECGDSQPIERITSYSCMPGQQITGVCYIGSVVEYLSCTGIVYNIESGGFQTIC